MNRARYAKYLQSEAWAKVKAAMPGNRACVACQGREALELHHMVYPKNVWKTKTAHCCWLCDRCHETFHRAPAKYIAMARTEYITAMVIRAQLNEEDKAIGMGAWAKSSSLLKSLGL